MLGEAQWKWFEDVLKNYNETFTLIVSGTQILPFNRYLLFEHWYKSSRSRLFDLLGRVKKNGIILITGDVHCAQILKTFCTLPEVGYDLYEISSSGLSHYDRVNFIMDYFMPNDYSIVPTVNYYNFGKIDFFWGNSKEDSKIFLSIIDIDNITRIKFSLSLTKDLSFDKSKITDPLCEAKLNSKFKSFGEYMEYYYNNKYFILILVLYKWILLTIAGLIYLAYFTIKFLITKILKFLRYKYNYRNYIRN
jgi:hypothetical protein